MIIIILAVVAISYILYLRIVFNYIILNIYNFKNCYNITKWINNVYKNSIPILKYFNIFLLSVHKYNK